MRPLKLEDIVPQTGEFTLRSTGITYRLRPVNVDDRMWINHTYGGNLENIFKKLMVKEICHIAFHQLDDSDKLQFVKKQVQIVDDEGSKKELELGGLSLFRTLIQGNDELTAILTALLHTIGISQPLIDEMAAELSSETAEKKSPNQTGEKSLTSSPASTDGHSQKSES